MKIRYWIIIFSLIVFYLIVIVFLISHMKAQKIRNDMIYSLDKGDCVSYLHILGMTQNKWYKLNNFFIMRKGIEENAKTLVEFGCPSDTPLVFPDNDNDLFYSWNKKEILEDVDRYYNKFYKKQFE